MHLHGDRSLKPTDMGLNCVLLCIHWEGHLQKLFIHDSATQRGVVCWAWMHDRASLVRWLCNLKKNLIFFHNREKYSLLFGAEASYLWVIAKYHKQQQPRKERATWATCWQLSGQMGKVCSGRSWDWQWIQPHPPPEIWTSGWKRFYFFVQASEL